MGASGGPDIVTRGLSYCFDATDKSSVTLGQSGDHTINDLAGNDPSSITGAQLNSGSSHHWMDFTADNMDMGASTGYDSADAGHMYQTIEMWYKPNTSGMKSSCCDTVFGRYHFRFFQIGASLYFMYGVDADGETATYTHPSYTVAYDVWHHVVGTRIDVSGTNRFQYWIDGVLKQNHDYNSSWHLRDYTGSTFYVSAAGHTNVNIAIARIYNRGLENDEVLHNFNIQRDRFGI